LGSRANLSDPGTEFEEDREQDGDEAWVAKQSQQSADAAQESDFTDIEDGAESEGTEIEDQPQEQDESPVASAASGGLSRVRSNESRPDTVLSTSRRLTEDQARGLPSGVQKFREDLLRKEESGGRRS
jgi:hypothetical protein